MMLFMIVLFLFEHTKTRVEQTDRPTDRQTCRHIELLFAAKKIFWSGVLKIKVVKVISLFEYIEARVRPTDRPTCCFIELLFAAKMVKHTQTPFYIHRWSQVKISFTFHILSAPKNTSAFTLASVNCKIPFTAPSEQLSSDSFVPGISGHCTGSVFSENIYDIHGQAVKHLSRSLLIGLLFMNFLKKS